MVGSVPSTTNYVHAGQSMNYAHQWAYHRSATSGSLSKLRSRLEAAVKGGKLTQAQANQILAHIAQKQ